MDVGLASQSSCGVDAAGLYAPGSTGRGLDVSSEYNEYCPFREYYQIGGDHQPDVAQPEPKKKIERELKGYTEPAHSPFGLIGQIARDTGWSINYIMRGVNYPMLMLMWQDYPRPVQGRKKTPLELFKELEAEENKEKAQKEKRVDPLGFFQQLEEEEK